MSGDRNPGRSPSCFASALRRIRSRANCGASALRSLGGGGPSGCSSVSRAPASGAGGRRSKACRPVQFEVAPLERDDFSSNRHHVLISSWSMIFFGKPVPTFPDHALTQGVSDRRRVAQRNQSAALRQPRSRVRITARRRKAPLNGRRLVPKTRVTARSEVRFLSLPPMPGVGNQ